MLTASRHDNKMADLQNFIVNEFGELRKKDALSNITDQTFKDRLKHQDAVNVEVELKKIFAGKNANINKNLKDFLSKRWNYVKGSYFCYTSLPDFEVTKVCIAIAKYLSDTNPLRLLMPTIKYFNHMVDGIDISKSQDLPLEQLCQSYILSDNHESLIPVSSLMSLDLASIISTVLVNPFINKGLTPIETFEINRLINHSILTETIVSAARKL